MKLDSMFDQLKARSEFAVKRVRVIANNVQPAARGRAFGAKRCNDDVAPWLDCMRYLAHVGQPIL